MGKQREGKRNRTCTNRKIMYDPKVQEIWQFFKDVRKEQEEITQLRALIQEKELTLLPRAITYDKDKVQVSLDDLFTKTCAIISDLEMELGKSVMILAKKQIKAEKMIRKLENANERKVMRCYYLSTFEGHSPSWMQVGIMMNYYESYVKKVHSDSLLHLSQKLGTK